MNTEVLVAYLGIGAVGKLISLKYPSPGQQWAAVMEVVAGAFVAGLTADILLPTADGWKAIVFASIPFVFAALGRFLAPAIDRTRIWYLERHANTETSQGQSSPGA